ncbi:hypothetical protein ACP6L2_03850 [Sphingobacterium lactis]|uniref:hypothetical protein n=1 Tax=Sphingobacterium lactis TaxID=797291 RepID=UPI003F81D6B7
MSRKNEVKPKGLNPKRGLEPTQENLPNIERELAWDAKIIGRNTENGIEIFNLSDEEE